MAEPQAGIPIDSKPIAIVWIAKKMPRGQYGIHVLLDCKAGYRPNGIATTVCAVAVRPEQAVRGKLGPGRVLGISAKARRCRKVRCLRIKHDLCSSGSEGTNQFALTQKP